MTVFPGHICISPVRDTLAGTPMGSGLRVGGMSSLGTAIVGTVDVD